MSVEKIQVDINYEVMLDLSPDLIDLWFIFRHFSNKFDSKYKTKD